MLPVFVILVASSALASAGTLQIRPVSSNNPAFRDNSPVGRVLSAIGEADHVSPNVLNIFETVLDLSKSGGNPALANGQLVAYFGETSVGRPGDACAAANYVTAYTRYVASGNPGGVRDALGNYIQVLAGNIDNIVRRVNNKESLKSVKGVRGRCANEGTSYDIDSAWDIILGATPTNQLSAITEQSCVAKRLYCAYSAVSNNVAAQFTASALPPTVQVFELSGRSLADFVARLGNRGDLGQAAATLKRDLITAVSKVSI